LSDSLNKLFADLERRKIVCPLPIPWEALFRFIEKTKKLKMYPIEKGPEVRLHNPLILGGWGASDRDKWHRFKYHLREADELGVLNLAEEFLSGLRPKDFLFYRDAMSEKSAWDVEKELKDEVDKVLIKALPFVQTALDLNVPQRQQYNPKKLHALFKKHGFFGDYAPTVSDATDFETVEALRQAHDIYNKQSRMMEGKRDLEDFCEAISDLRIRTE
jgi:hypothetical protein|tara:strand:- start:184 stop:834 length:651 start_codon:yes stop_codon:yes gene_type:complete